MDQTCFIAIKPSTYSSMHQRKRAWLIAAQKFYYPQIPEWMNLWRPGLCCPVRSSDNQNEVSQLRWGDRSFQQLQNRHTAVVFYRGSLQTQQEPPIHFCK